MRLRRARELAGPWVIAPLTTIGAVLLIAAGVWMHRYPGGDR